LPRRPTAGQPHRLKKFFARRDLNEYIKTREKAGSVSFKKFTKTAITKHSTDYFVPVYDFSSNFPVPK